MPRISCLGLLFDMDGVLVDSTPAVARVWGLWARKHGFDAESILRREVGMGLHGVREGAEVLGGAAHIQSHPGTGTRIEVILPRVLREPVTTADRAIVP